MFKKIVSCAAAFVLALGGLSALPFEGVIDTAVTAKAESNNNSILEDDIKRGLVKKSDNGFYYAVTPTPIAPEENIENGYAVILGYTKNDKNIVIPDTLDGYKVGYISQFGDDNIETLTLPKYFKGITYGGNMPGNFVWGCDNFKAFYIDENNTDYCTVDGVLFTKDKKTLVQCPIGYKGTYNVPDTVEKIENFAFDGCKGLTGITIPNGVTTLGYWSFKGCEGLKSVDLPDSVKILQGAFWDCHNLQQVKLPSKIENIGGAFLCCTALKSITIPNSVTSIGDGEFSGCESLKSIAIPDSVTSIGDGAFSHCTSLTNITIPNSVTSIGEGAFIGCTSLTNITIPNSVTSIDWKAFCFCTSLTNITIPNSVTSIGDSAFSNCESLKSITIPNSVTSIGGYAFYDTPWLEAQRKKNPLVIVNNILIDGETCKGNIVIPNGVTSIGEDAFRGCESLKSITIPNSVTNIGEDAFYGCESLKSITIPSSVTSIGDWAFSYCTSLTSITIPNSVTSIGDAAFYGCDNLTINCYSGSTAEKYAKDNNIKYELLDTPKAKTNLSKLSVKADKTVFGYTGKAKAPTVTIKDGSYTLKQGTDYTLSYKNNKNIGTGTVTVTGKGNYTGTKTLSFTIIPSNIGGFKAASTSASAVKLSWNKVNGAGGYIVYQYNNSTKKWVRIAKTGNVNTYTVKSLKAGTTYKYAVKAYKTVGGKDYTSAKYPTITTSTKPAKVSFKAAAASKAVKFSWSKVTGATNYIVYYRVKGTSSWKNVKVGSGVTSRTISGLVKGKTYEVTVKAVRTVNKVNYNGAYDVKTVKVK